MLQDFTQYMSWLSIVLAVVGIFFILVDSIPVQLREIRGQDYQLIRRLLPVLTISFVILAIVLVMSLTYNIYHDINGHDVRSNITRTMVGMLIFIKGLSWRLVYKKG